MPSPGTRRCWPPHGPPWGSSPADGWRSRTHTTQRPSADTPPSAYLSERGSGGSGVSTTTSPDAPRRLLAPIAPGLIDRVGIAGVARMAPGRAHVPSIPAGSLAFDGERELTFTESDQVSVRLVPDAFRTIDVPACMAHAAATGLFIRNPD